MIKGLIIAAIVFISSAYAAGGLTAYAQTTNTTNTTNTTVTPTMATTPTTTVPSGAPATGKAQ